jgi:lysophospholipase L1-like esterase
MVFLGNSITWAGMYVNDVETYLRVQYPGWQFECINVGLSSETVSGLSEEGHAGGSPRLVFACYGINDGIYMPFDTGRFEKFKNGINWLHEQVEKTGARIIHLTPPYYDEARAKNDGYAAVLNRYADWILKKERSHKWEVIDIHYPMKKYLKAHRKVDAKFGLDGFELAQDGVHPGETGHWIIARQILLHLGFKAAANSPGILQSIPQISKAAELLALVTKRENMMRDAWLTATKHSRPGLPVGLPLNEAQAKAEEMMNEIKVLLQK